MNYITSIILIVGSLVYLVWGMPQIKMPKHKWGFSVGLLFYGVLIHVFAVEQFGLDMNYYAYISLALLLFLLAIGDVLTYELPVQLLLIGYFMATTALLLARQDTWYLNVLSALGAFGLFYGLGKLFRGGIGEGDAHVIALLALNFGWVHTLLVVMIALVVSSLWGLVMIIVSRKSKKTVLPFVPFIALAHLGILIL